ncbi:MAG: response regulator transcription factor [Spirochaetes bacterium]|nr:MAG: response regulator transcription factor [Spirochaetota bacterium]
MPRDILIIDDDKKLAGLLTEYLAKFELRCRAAHTAGDGLAQIAHAVPDLVILDVMLPGMDGFEVCRRIRASHTVPVIMLTARGELADRVVGLEMGADDYLPKPFEPRELVARIQSVLRRSSPRASSRIARFAGLEIDYHSRAVHVDGNPVELTAMEFGALAVFTRNSGIALDRDRIFELLKGLDDDSYDRSIDVLVSRLRQKLGDDPKAPRFLRTLRGTGYMFIGGEDGGAHG